MLEGKQSASINDMKICIILHSLEGCARFKWRKATHNSDNGKK